MSATCAKCSSTDGAAGPGAKLLMCARCKTARYCGVTCQRSDWERHKPECALLRPGVTARDAARKMNRDEDGSSAAADAFFATVDFGNKESGAEYLRKHHGRSTAADPPETHKPRSPLVSGGPEIKPGWGAAVSWNTMFTTPLEQAVHKCSPKAVEALIRRGEDVHGRDRMTAWTPLHKACALAENPGAGKQLVSCARLLLAAGADPNATSRTRNAPLHNLLNSVTGGARPADVAAMAQLLVDAGADVLLPCQKGFTPLSLCDHFALRYSGYADAEAVIRRAAAVRPVAPSRCPAEKCAPLPAADAAGGGESG